MKTSTKTATRKTTATFSVNDGKGSHYNGEIEKLNKRERRAQALLAHYATCERLAVALGMPASKVDGKKISVALLHIEHDARNAATAQCNGAAYLNQPYRSDCDAGGNESDDAPWGAFCEAIEARVAAVFGKLPPGFRFNKDPRGYALKIDPANAAGRALCEKCGLHTDWGRNGILSPEITGD